MLDGTVERTTVSLATRTSRRSLLSSLGAGVVALV